MAMRAIRGATCLSQDNAEEMSEAVGELIAEMLQRNSVAEDHVISLFLTGTPDLRSAFPAAGARLHGLHDVPLMCAQEMDVVGALPQVIRIMAHVETDRSRADITHVYLRGTEVLRKDLPHNHRGSADA
ncbi:MAG: chorismate mutase [Candidatus Nanopelagicales bacterium]|nr:chorismate mutase [Candidatus Nanopelagicales bacterium]